MDDKAEVSSETEFEKKRKSLNKSKSKESDMAETESSNENIIIRSRKNKSSNSSLKKRVKTRQLDANLIEGSGNECIESEVVGKKSSSSKKTLHTNYSRAVNLESDSDVSRDNIDSQDSDDERVELPKFLFGGESNSDSDNENESNKSIDSDIRREYNLDGEDVAEFADDDVPGDECRASETESSDPDDDGSDLLDFVVDDDEDEEAEEENEEDEDEGEQEETQTVENEEDLNNEEDANTDDEEEEVVVDEEAADEDEEMEVVEEVDSIEEKEQSEDEQESVEKAHKSLDTSKKGMNKSRKSADSSLTQTTENNKGKKRRLKADMSLTEKDENECNLSTVSLSTSLKGKKSKQKRVLNECTDDAKQLLNDSPIILNKKTEKLFKSMECSTPKTSSSKREKFSINQHTPDVSLEASCKNLSREIREGKEDTYPDKEEVQDKAQKIEKNSKKLRKLKDKENLVHRSLPSELNEVVGKTNVSRATSFKVTILNETAPIPYSESPTVTHLRKEKLNDSAPELKLSSKSRRKSINSSTNNESSNSLKEIEEKNAAVEEQAEEFTTEVNDSLKKKLLKVADNILESDRQKKHKKRKQVAVEQNSVQFFEVNFEENIDSRITKKKQQRDDSTGIVVENEEEEETSVDKKKKKKKKKKVVSMEVDEPVVKESSENLIETDLENNNEPIHNDEKKKKKKGKKSKDSTESQLPAKKKAKNEKKIAVPYEEVSVTKVSKKRQKLSEDVARENEQVSIEKVPKKKQKLSKDAALEQEEASDKKLRKKKQKLSSNDSNSQVEEPSPKKLSKKKGKLSSENVSKHKAKFVMAAVKSQQAGDVASDSDEGPEVVAFSKARDEALGMIKRTADGIKANKEIKKKKQREHLERMQAEKEIKMKKSKVVELQKKSVKRLPDEVLENLSDIPSKPLKKRKLCQFDDEVLPSRSILNFMDKETRDIRIEDDILSLPSSAGSTTHFDVVNLQKLKKKKKAAVVSFRQKMLARNSRHPVSAYLMYLEKQKASGKDKFCNKP